MNELGEPATHSQRQPVVPDDVARSGGWGMRLRHWGQHLTLRAIGSMRPVLGERNPNSFGIFVYHRITEPTAGACTPTNNVPPKRFQAQMEGLIARGYQAWPLRKVIDFCSRGQAIPHNTFVVTFDDGYQNNFLNAWPILKRLGIPATIFLNTAYLDNDTPLPFDDWLDAGAPGVPAESWQPLSTSQCREMLDEGLIDLGTHTHTHADFRNQPEALRQDLLTSLDVLGERFGLENATFAFPYGTGRRGFSGPVLAAAARQSGVLCSLTTENQLVEADSDPFDWGRFTVSSADTPTTLATRLDGWYDVARTTWRRLRRPRSARHHDQPMRAGREPAAGTARETDSPQPVLGSGK